MMYSLVKRVFDIVIALSSVSFLLPIFLFIAVLIRLQMGIPIFFVQTRPGLNGKCFRLYKFRTMTNICHSHHALLPDGQRITKLGGLLRSTSLDELPQLLNVLKGDMSLVGPRPLLMQYLHRYTPEQARRHDVKPGITGWTQVNGRNALTWDEKFRLDVWYVDHRSLYLDIKIIIMTLLRVLRREGISQPGQATMEEFKGMMGKP